MTMRLNKKSALTLLCLFREAERSVHWALTCPNHWSEFRAYYDGRKHAQISEMIAALRRSGAVAHRFPSRPAIDGASELWHVARMLLGRIRNRFKRTWSISEREASFFVMVLEGLLGAAQRAEAPPPESLFCLRMDCYESHRVISRKLAGLPEMDKAMRIEHFFQNERIDWCTFKELGIDFRE